MSDWISVKDRLPDKKGFVFCKFSHETLLNHIAYFCDVAYYDGEGEWSGEYLTPARNPEVLYWMPIPEEGESPMTIKVKYFDDEIPRLEIATDERNWIDLRAAETVEMKSGGYKLIPLGVAMQLPKGYEAHVVPRSSTLKNFGIVQANCFGVIDNAYCGDNDQWMFPALALRNTTIHKGDRICQFRIEKNQPKIEFETVEELENENRGGFGSTGKD